MATYESKKYAHTGNLLTSLQAPNMADGTVLDAEFQYINTLSANAQTQITDRLQISTGGAFADNINVDFGAGTDLRVTSDGTSGLLKGNALEMQTSTGAEYLTATASGAVDIYHNGAKKFETSAAGVTVTGTITGDIVATSLTSGTIPDGRFPGTLPAASGANLTSLPAANLSGTSAAINGAAITNLNASNLGSGTVPDARLPAAALTSDYVKLGVTTTGGSAAASIALAGSSYFDAAYKHYKIMLHGKWQNEADSASYLALQVSVNGGSSYLAGGYFFAQLSAATDASGWTYEDTTMLKFSKWNPTSSTSDANRNMSSEVTIFDANGSYYKPVTAAGGSFDRGLDGVHYNVVGGIIETTSAIDGVKILIADGSNISANSGFTLYGIK